MEGPALSSLHPLTDAIVEAAKQALVEFHASGAEHNDLRWDNIVLQVEDLLLSVLLLSCMLPTLSQVLTYAHGLRMVCAFLCSASHLKVDAVNHWLLQHCS